MKQMSAMKQNTGKIDPLDARLGELLRLARTACGMSQEKLGAMNGLTFQQIQKYERGHNRVSVSRLVHLAKFLGVSATWFVEKLAEDRGGEERGFKLDLTLLNWREVQELLQAYTNITDKDVRRFLRRIMTLLADRATGSQ